MAEATLDTLFLNGCIDRWRGGELAGRDALIEVATGRLEPLARRMLKDFPGVRRFSETDDVLQGALLRLLHTLEAVRPSSTRDFFSLAGTAIRRELLDLVRHFRGPRAAAAKGSSDSSAGQLFMEHAAPTEPDDLDRWCAFHEGVESLSVEEREVVGLIFYHGWSQAQAAELLQMSERTVRRRWADALERLRLTIGLPEVN